MDPLKDLVPGIPKPVGVILTAGKEGKIVLKLEEDGALVLTYGGMELWNSWRRKKVTEGNAYELLLKESGDLVVQEIKSDLAGKVSAEATAAREAIYRSWVRGRGGVLWSSYTENGNTWTNNLSPVYKGCINAVPIKGTLDESGNFQLITDTNIWYWRTGTSSADSLDKFSTSDKYNRFTPVIGKFNYIYVYMYMNNCNPSVSPKKCTSALLKTLHPPPTTSHTKHEISCLVSGYGM